MKRTGQNLRRENILNQRITHTIKNHELINYNSNLHDYDIIFQQNISLKDSNQYTLQYEVLIQDF